MISVTERAASELQELKVQNGAGPAQGVRLSPDGQGGISMSIQAPHEGDVELRHGDDTLLIVDATIAEPLDGMVLDCAPAPDGQEAKGQFVLTRPEQQT